MRRVPGKHEPNNRNRSSKHLSSMTGIRPAIRSASNEYLSSHTKDPSDIYGREISRRSRKNSKK